jgi:hypothetical protein
VGDLEDVRVVISGGEHLGVLRHAEIAVLVTDLELDHEAQRSFTGFFTKPRSNSSTTTIGSATMGLPGSGRAASHAIGRPREGSCRRGPGPARLRGTGPSAPLAGSAPEALQLGSALPDPILGRSLSSSSCLTSESALATPGSSGRPASALPLCHKQIARPPWGPSLLSERSSQQRRAETAAVRCRLLTQAATRAPPARCLCERKAGLAPVGHLRPARRHNAHRREGYGVSTIFPCNPPRSNRAYASRKRSRGRISATRTVSSPAAARRANSFAASGSGWTCTV